MNGRLLKKLLIIISAFFLLSFNVSAGEIDFLEDQLDSSGASNLFDILNKDQTDMLDVLGVNSVTPDDLFSVSPRKIFELLHEIIAGVYKTPFDHLISASVIIVAVSIALQFISTGGKLSESVNIFSILTVSLTVVIPIADCLTRVISAIDMTADFMIALIPVLATVLTVSGNPTAALSYNSLCFSAAQAAVQLSSNFIRPLIQTTLSLSVMTGVCTAVNFEKLVSFIKRIVVFLMSMISTIFITMLSLKGMLSASADTVAVRGVRFMIGNLIPVVGGAISDAYTSITGTLILVKNTAAVFGVIAVTIINLPVVAECLCWIFGLNMLAILSDMFSQDKASSLLRSVSSVVTLLLVSLIFIVVVFVLSVGLVMVIKGA